MTNERAARLLFVLLAVCLVIALAGSTAFVVFDTFLSRFPYSSF
jgi:hypothetical protein